LTNLLCSALVGRNKRMNMSFNEWAADFTERLGTPPTPRDAWAELSKDAERYRWLRDNPWPPVLEADILLHRNARWDAEIDAAMAESRAVGDA